MPDRLTHGMAAADTLAATTEEILLRLRQLATDYSYYTSVGFSYRFGSAFNNVVNPRFR